MAAKLEAHQGVALCNSSLRRYDKCTSSRSSERPAA